MTNESTFGITHNIPYFGAAFNLYTFRQH